MKNKWAIALTILTVINMYMIIRMYIFVVGVEDFLQQLSMIR